MTQNSGADPIPTGQQQPQSDPSNSNNLDSTSQFSQPQFSNNNSTVIDPTNNNDVASAPKTPAPNESTPNQPQQQSSANSAADSAKSLQLQRMVQQLYMAQGQVQLEAAEIQRAQTIASSAQQNLEDSANNVRVITAALRAAQETVANAALRAQTAQLQLAAHDQLLFTARQKVDALSAQMVGLQAEIGIAGDQKVGIDLPALLQRLRAPLPADEQPKPVAPLGGSNGGDNNGGQSSHPLTIHSANPNVASRTINSAPMLQANENEDDAIRKRSTDERNSRHQTTASKSLTSSDVHDLLSWVRRAKDDDLARATAADDDERRWGGSGSRVDGQEARVAGGDGKSVESLAESRRQRYVTDFVSNMQHLSGVGANRNAHLIRRTVRGVKRRRHSGDRLS